MALAPDTVNVLREGQEVAVPIEQVRRGDVLRIAAPESESPWTAFCWRAMSPWTNRISQAKAFPRKSTKATI